MGYIIHILMEDKYPMVRCVLHFDQVWISIMVPNFTWVILNKALVTGFKYLFWMTFLC